MNSEQPLDVLIFAPHPDDAELAMAGTICKLIAAGKRVGVIDLSRGELGTKGDAETRAREVDASSRILGLHHRGNLDMGDGQIRDTQENRLNVVDAIRRFRSPYVFACYPHDPHPDHHAGSQVVQAGFFLARLPKVQTAYPAYSPQWCLYYYLHEIRDITFAVDITQHMEKKREALRAFQSQFVTPQLPRDYTYLGTSDYLNQVEAYNRTIGAKIGADYAEGFWSERPLSLSLPTMIGSCNSPK